MPLKRPNLVLLLLAALLLAAFLVNLLLVPLNWRLPALYVVPMLAAVHRASPRVTAIFAVAGLVLDLAEVALRQLPLALEARRWPLLAVVAYLSYRLAVRMQDRQRDLQNFLGMVAHDLRGPITTTPGYAQLALRPGAAPEHTARALATVEAQSRRMKRTVADLLDAARVGAGRFEIQSEPVDLVALARRVVEAGQATTGQESERD